MRYVTLALAALALAGCVVIKSPPDPGPNAVGGSLAGAGVGALIGARAEGSASHSRLLYKRGRAGLLRA